ncbi:hypothetical protein POV27_19780 [Aureisphaera galaxeae]|uniref:hypothetical protein n=1 Tax=Aureisphaera galaxeae TaxID=1538023 RepID=UPI002350D7D6|nr:hypothetical protein [Aureisphaera galaxeae]MDC8006304.1 hypothetical protein [Aureisphaera galaxeae]
MQIPKHILVFTPDGTGIKNYLYSDVFKNSEAKISLFHNFDDDTLSQISSNIEVHGSHEIPSYGESVKEKFLRELIHAVRIRENAKREKNPTIFAFRKKKHKGWKLKLFFALIDLRAKFVGGERSLQKLEAKYEKALTQNPFYHKITKLLGEIKPDTVFCTHQRALKAPTVFKAARDMGIKTVTVIYSWDNIPKARLALRSDSYLLWSDYMKEEMMRFYPEIPSERLIVTGTPQFEFYKDETNIIPKDEFYRRYGLDPSKKIICFSGDDVKTSPYDPYYLRDLAKGITEAGMTDQCQIVFRRCPVDVSGRYDWVLKEYPDLIIDMPPLWNFNSAIWTAIYPQYEDVKLLASLAYYGDVVLNVGSTMAFDFGMFQKPCIYINYDHTIDPNWSVETIYNYQHFRSMPDKKAVYWWNEREAIGSIVQQALNEPETKIQTWFEIVVNHAERASKNVKKALL